METINETAIINQAPLPNQKDCGGRLEARPISQPRCQRMIAEGTPKLDQNVVSGVGSGFSSLLNRTTQDWDTVQYRARKQAVDRVMRRLLTRAVLYQSYVA
jgi:hypothetical protein